MTATAIQTVDGDGQPAGEIVKVDGLAAEEKSFIEQAKAHLGIDEKPPAVAKKDEPKASDTEAKYLKEIARLQRQVREIGAESKKSESWKEKVAAYDELRELYKKDKVAALAKLAGRDGLDEVADLIAPFYEAKAAKEEGGAPAGPGPEIKLVLEKLEAVTKELADLRAEKTQEKTAKTEAQQKAEQEGALNYAKTVAAKAKDKFVICARPENVAEAAALANDGAAVLLQKRTAEARGIKYEEVTAEMTAAEVAKLTPEASEALLMQAYDEVESQYEALGRRFAKVTPEEPRRYSFGPRAEAPAPPATPITLPENPTEEDFRRYALAKLGL